MARILIADDEDLERRALGLIVSEASEGEGFSVEEAKNGLEALSLGLRGNFDVIFLDVKMPGMDGIAVAEGLRKANIQSAIVIVSAYDTFEYAQKAIRLGVYEYLLKPAAREDVLQALLRSLELQREPESLARLRRESVSALSSALRRLEALMIGEMERGELLLATAADYERLASLEGLPKAALAFRLDTGQSKTSAILDKSLAATVLDAASRGLSSAARVLSAGNEEGGSLLVYGADLSATTAAVGVRAMRGLSRRLRDNPLEPMILAAEEKLRSLAPYHLFWGLSGPSSTTSIVLLFSRAIEACRLAYTDCPTVCLTPLQSRQTGDVSELASAERVKPGLALRALDTLKEDCAREWNLETLAQRLSVSPFHLSHLLSRELGMGFSELLQRLRIGKAKEILVGGASAKEASHLVGFSDQAYFTKVFKKLEGRTPGEYLEENAKKYQ